MEKISFIHHYPLNSFITIDYPQKTSIYYSNFDSSANTRGLYHIFDRILAKIYFSIKNIYHRGNKIRFWKQKLVEIKDLLLF